MMCLQLFPQLRSPLIMGQEHSISYLSNSPLDCRPLVAPRIMGQACLSWSSNFGMGLAHIAHLSETPKS